MDISTSIKKAIANIENVSKDSNLSKKHNKEIQDICMSLKCAIKEYENKTPAAWMYCFETEEDKVDHKKVYTWDVTNVEGFMESVKDCGAKIIPLYNCHKRSFSTLKDKDIDEAWNEVSYIGKEMRPKLFEFANNIRELTINDSNE